MPKGAPTPRSVQQAKSFRSRTSRVVQLDYLLFQPAQPPQARLPLLIFLHGSGERGSNPWKVTKHGPPKIVAKQPDFPFIVLSPQCPARQLWDTSAVLALIDHALVKLPVDQRRVYLTGISMGGYATWSLAISHPEQFAAVAPICGGGEILPLLLQDDRRKSAALKRLPIWAFHGARDTVVHASESERMIEAFKTHAKNPNTKLTIYDDLEHDSWTRAYEETNLFDWFLQHKIR